MNQTKLIWMNLELMMIFKKDHVLYIFGKYCFKIKEFLFNFKRHLLWFKTSNFKIQNN